MCRLDLCSQNHLGTWLYYLNVANINLYERTISHTHTHGHTMFLGPCMACPIFYLRLTIESDRVRLIEKRKVHFVRDFASLMTRSSAMLLKKKIIATLYECTRLTDISSIPHILVFTQELEMCKRPSMHLCISRVQVMYCLFDQKGKYPST